MGTLVAFGMLWKEFEGQQILAEQRKKKMLASRSIIVRHSGFNPPQCSLKQSRTLIPPVRRYTICYRSWPDGPSAHPYPPYGFLLKKGKLENKQEIRDITSLQGVISTL